MAARDMPATDTTVPAGFGRRVLRSIAGRIRGLRALPALSPGALVEAWREQRGGHPVDEAHDAHLHAAVDWLARAQDATPDGGFARGYALLWNPYFGRRGWLPSYPETTGYIIPTLFEAAGALGRAELRERAERAARWELAIQLPSGAVRGGVMGEAESPAVFNTGQVLFGWLAALEQTGDAVFADAAARAGRWLVSVLDADGHWRRGGSRFARAGVALYNARTAWALAEAGSRLAEPTFTAAAARNLRAVLAAQLANGWLPDCCLSDVTRPLLHTLAYAIRGLLEGGRVLGDEALLRGAGDAAGRLAHAVRADGWMAGRFDADWRPAATWSCLTGQAQMANNWIRLHDLTGEPRWLEPVPRVLRFLKTTQNRTSGDGGLRGGIKGSAPLGGGYNRYEVLNWATKYFADALLRDDRVRGRRAASPAHVLA
jgi:hypothetical protein